MKLFTCPAKTHSIQNRYVVGRVFFALWLIGSALVASPVHAQEVPELQITSKYYVVLDAATGEIYAQREAHHHAPMASLTKVFTTIEALNRASLTTDITTDDTDMMDAAAKTMGFGPGETFSLKDLLYGMMLPSGNDAAHAIARGLGAENGDKTGEDSSNRFVDWMNQRLQAMGLVDTHLSNPHGWGVPNHYSSAYDLAAFTRYALQYPTFVDLISTPIYDTQSGGYEVTNTNKMLNTYPGIIGGKTGYDDDAGYCLIEVAKRGDTTMISVTLDGVAPDDWYDDNRVLLDYAFDQKAEREKSGKPFDGDVVSYVDPGAALVANSVIAGGATTGQDATNLLQSAATPPKAVVPVASPTSAPVVGSVDSLSNSDNSSGGSDSLFKIVAIAAALVLVVGVKLFDTVRGSPTGGWSLKKPAPEPVALVEESVPPIDQAAMPSTGGDQGDD
jgi:D-alanyl-D-alanine carboxypeptidase